MIERVGFVLLAGLISANSAFAAAADKICQGASTGTGANGQVSTDAQTGITTCATGGGSLRQDVGNITDLLLFIAGAIAVIFIIIGGIRYITSTGDAARIKAAKDTILYSIIGLVVALLAFAIVQFVNGRLG
jgi:hypothetical protein